MADEQHTMQDLFEEHPDLDKALEEVRTNPEEAEKFAADPEAYLTSRGVSTDNLRMTAGELSEAELEQVAGGVDSAARIGICGGVGAGICASVGGDIDL